MDNLEATDDPELLIPPLTKQPYPWLIIFDGDDHDVDKYEKQILYDDSDKQEQHIFYSVGENRYEVRCMPDFFRGKDITCCYEGWLVLENYKFDDQCNLFNLSTKEHLLLPPPDIHTCIHHTVMSSKLSNCHRLLFIQWDYRRVKSCYVGDTSFVEQLLSPHEDTEDPELFAANAATNFQGKLYIMSFEYNLVSAEFSDPDLHLTTVIRAANFPSRDLSQRSETWFYLVESCGELLFIYKNGYDNEVVDIKIFRANLKGPESEWESVESLGDRAIFLDNYKGLSSSYGASNLDLKPNSIYFVNSMGNRNLYIYDLKDQSITLTLPCPIINATDVYLCWATIN